MHACLLVAGESLAQVLCLAGVRPVPDSIGRVNKLELIPLEELGRPRVDVVVSCSGVFRDLFINQMNLLDRGVSDSSRFLRAKHAARGKDREAFSELGLMPFPTPISIPPCAVDGVCIMGNVAEGRSWKDGHHGILGLFLCIH